MLLWPCLGNKWTAQELLLLWGAFYSKHGMRVCLHGTAGAYGVLACVTAYTRMHTYHTHAHSPAGIHACPCTLTHTLIPSLCPPTRLSLGTSPTAPSTPPASRSNPWTAAASVAAPAAPPAASAAWTKRQPASGASASCCCGACSGARRTLTLRKCGGPS